MPDAAMTTPAQNARTRQQWAEIINADWRKAVGSIIQVGRDLVEARAELGKVGFTTMVREDLSFSPEVARRLRLIASDQNILNWSSGNQLPPSWRVLANLTGLSKDDFDKGVESGIISEATPGRVASAYRGALNTPEDQPWGTNLSRNTLPKPTEARNIARETGRMVAANDGNLYSGTTEAEDEDYLSRREQTYGVMDAIKTLADVGVAPDEWLKQSKPHWLNRFDVGDLERAVAWLEQLRADYFQREGIVDAD